MIALRAGLVALLLAHATGVKRSIDNIMIYTEKDGGLIGYWNDEVECSYSHPADLSFIALPELKPYYFSVLANNGNSFGVIDKNDNSVQFYISDDGILLDISVVAKKGSFQKYLNSLDEGWKIIENLPQDDCSNHSQNIEGLSFVPW